jgi:UDP-glucose 4-epimerase
MERVLVSGSAGFIGGYLVGELRRRGYQVVGVDDFSKYGRLRTSHDGDPGYTFVRGDAADTGLMTGLLADCDHFESAASWPSHEGQQREAPPPVSSYGFQKLTVEYFARAAWDQYRLPFTIVRPFNCVGIGESRALRDDEVMSGNVKLAMGHVVPDLVQKVLKGQDPLRLLGSGSQLRHYTYDVPLRVVHDDPYEFDVQRRVPATGKARSLLGFEATTTLDEMLDEVIPWVARAIEAGTI